MISIRQAVLPQRVPLGETVCSVENVTLNRGGRPILDDLSMDLRAGEVLSVLGPNGAGKSTLLGVISGDITPDSGTVRFRDEPLNEWSLQELSRARSVLLQENSLVFPFTVAEVVEMGRAPWRRTPAESDDDEAVAEALEQADVAHLGTRAVPSLSGGERARTAFARVLAGRTGVLMLDEPTAALDLGHEESVLNLVRQRAQHGDAALLILHDLNAAAAYSDRIILLRDGAAVASGPPEQVLTADIVSDVYQTPVEVIPHPVTGRGIVVPVRL